MRPALLPTDVASVSSAPRASGRGGRPPRLSSQAVITAARVIVEREGIEALTMRAVARELDSSAMAIYRHVRDKDQLLVLLLDQLAQEVSRPALPQEPRARLTQACRTMRDGLAEHPWIVDVLAQGDLIAPSIVWLIEEIVSGFLACDLSHEQAVDGYRAVWELTVGDLIIRRGLERTAALGRPPFVLEVLRSVEAQECPALARVADQWAAARERDVYEMSLEALIEGLIGYDGECIGEGQRGGETWSGPSTTGNV